MIRLILPILLISIWIAPLIAPFDPMLTNATASIRPPDAQHLLGTDALGRDVLSRLLHGGHRTLGISIGALLIAIIPGVLIAVPIGFIGGWLDRVTQIGVTALLALPSYLLAFVMMTVLGQGTLPLAFSIGIALFAPFYQMARAAAMSIKHSEYIIAAQALGATRFRIFYRYLLPNCIPALVSYGSITFSYCVLNVGAFGFLGLIGEPGIPEWGVILAEGREVFREAPWVGAAPGVCISGLVLLINRLADTVTLHE